MTQTRHMNISEFIFPAWFADFASSRPGSFGCPVAFPPPKPPVWIRLECVLIPGLAPHWYWLSDLSSATFCHWDMKKQNSYSSSSLPGMRRRREWRELWCRKSWLLIEAAVVLRGDPGQTAQILWDLCLHLCISQRPHLCPQLQSERINASTETLGLFWD